MVMVLYCHACGASGVYDITVVTHCPKCRSSSLDVEPRRAVSREFKLTQDDRLYLKLERISAD